MARIAFRMKLHKGMEEEYRKRHDAIWPELAALLKAQGVQDYSIFLDPDTNALFGVLTIGDPVRLDALPGYEVMQKWWRYMSDIMDTNADQSPVSIPLKEVFYLE